MSIFLSILAVAGSSRSIPQEAVAPAGFRVEPLPSPAPPGSRLPNLSTGPDARIRASWVEEEDLGAAGTRAKLKVSRLDEDGWSAPVAVASGTDWFVNWTDFPTVVPLDARHLLAQFLQRSGEGSYDYHVEIARSSDGGQTWSEPARLHSHAGAGEHGFVSIVPIGSGAAAAVWLDGRNAGEHGGADGEGAMRLYARTVGADGVLGEELVLDDRVCDCCPTAAVRAADGALVVAYRDRSKDEVRDISVVRVDEDRLRRPGPSGPPLRTAWGSADGWKIAGCPVNGPALAVAGRRIGIAWFTMDANGRGRVLCAFSKDDGKSFSSPVTIADERAHGRVDAEFDDAGRFVVTWLMVGEDRAEWRVARVAPEPGLRLDVFTVASAEPSRMSGLARLTRDAKGMVFAWTEPGEKPRVGMRRLAWE
ncbi:MAG: sialidase family protein [Planctomycetota bacterium]